MPLLLELGGGVVVFRLALFPLMMWLFTKFFERQSFWERISARQSAYGVPESVEICREPDQPEKSSCLFSL